MGAVNKLKNGKAGVALELFPRWLRAREEFRALILDFVHTVWRERRVPKECADSVLICTHSQEG